MDPMDGINHELGARGERERALGILRELHTKPIPHAAFVCLPSSGPIREDPRLADVLGFVKLWEARGYPPGCQRVTLPAGDRLDCAGLAR
jgi:hypothetical protein